MKKVDGTFSIEYFPNVGIYCTTENSKIYKVICNDIAPSFNKLISMIAGAYKVHPSWISLFLGNESSTLVKSNHGLLKAFESCENDDLVFQVALTQPTFVLLK